MKISALFISILVTLSCNSTRQTTYSRIGLVPLNNYALNSDVTLTDPINYKFIINPDEFQKTFHAINSTTGNTISQNFTGQSVAAVIMKSSVKPVSIQLTKAEIIGKDLNVYYTIEDKQTLRQDEQAYVALATVPKASNVTRVNFDRNSIKQKT